MKRTKSNFLSPQWRGRKALLGVPVGITCTLLLVPTLLLSSPQLTSAFTASPTVMPRHQGGRGHRSANAFYAAQKRNTGLPILDAELVSPDGAAKKEAVTGGVDARSSGPKLSQPEATTPATNLNPKPVLVLAWQELFASRGKKDSSSSFPASPASTTTAATATAAAAALALVLMLSPMAADAAMSGGRMGGSFPSSRQSMSRPSYGGGSYSRGYSLGFRSGYYSRPGITVAPFAPIVPFSPFGGFGNPFYFGGPGIITYSRGPSFFDLLFLGGIGWLFFSVVRGATAATSSVSSSWTSVFDGDRSSLAESALGPGTSIVQLSVALEVPRRDDPSSILSVLNRLSETARTDSRVGVQNLTSQVALELLRRKSSIVMASGKSKHYGSRDKAMREYGTVSVKERAKFEQETVSRYGGVDYGARSSSAAIPGSGRGDDGQATVAVVTLLLAIDGDSTKVPAIRSVSDVEEALRTVASDSKVDSCLQSAEILWTPTDRSETLTMRDVIADYPELRSV